MGEYYKIITEEDHLEHYGVKGMKWDLKFRKHTDSWYKRMKRRVRGTANNVVNSMAKAYDKEYGEEESRTYSMNPKTGKYEIMNKGWTNSDKAKGYVKNKARDAHYAVADAARTTVKYGKKVASMILKAADNAAYRTNVAYRAVRIGKEFVKGFLSGYNKAQ